MMFNKAHDFYINQFYAIDGQNPSRELKRLLDAACPGAGHRSAERGDAPKCHPKTRKAVLSDIMSWVASKDPKKPLMWLSGPAGAGKTSIAQTVCERYDAEQKLLASFFFSRSAVGTGRGDGNRLVPTIAVQLAIAIPETKSLIVRKLEEDPLLLTYSMEDQMRQLILEPLATTLATLSKKHKVPYLVVIDGLDECSSRSMQAKIIAMFATILSKTNTRIRCLIASRPELEIRNTFKFTTTSGLCTQIVLDAHYKPDDDIRVYLKSEFSSLKRKHPLMSHLSRDSSWPTSKEIEWLVHKSSGQFIYASTVMKYLKDLRGNPRDRLSAIINHRISDKQSPFSALDTLYMFILDTATSKLQGEKQLLTALFSVLLFAKVQRSWTISEPKYDAYDLSSMDWSIPWLEQFLLKTTVDLELLFSDLHSILFIPGRNLQEAVRFHHASFGDFLKDPSRSGRFHIDEKSAHKVLAQLCFRKLLECRSCVPDADGLHVLRYCRIYYMFHVQKSGHFPRVVYCRIQAKLMGLGWINWGVYEKEKKSLEAMHSRRNVHSHRSHHRRNLLHVG